MENFAAHMRITGPNPGNDEVDSRKAAATDLSATWSKIKDAKQILAKASDIAHSLGGDGKPSSKLGTEVETAVQPHASAFLYEERQLDVGICAGMAVVQILAQAPTITVGLHTPDVYAVALWSALGFQPPLGEAKRENLRQEVLTTAKRRSKLSANKARERSPVQDVQDLIVTIDATNKATTNAKKAIAVSIEQLRRNAVLDREELDFLWWIQLGRSRLLNRPLSGIPEVLRLITSGIETADYLRRLPADVHREMVLRTVDEDPELNLDALLKALGDDLPVLKDHVSSSTITSYPTIFPLLNAVVTGETDVQGAKQKRKASEWASRALLEAGFVKLIDSGIPVL